MFYKRIVVLFVVFIFSSSLFSIISDKPLVRIKTAAGVGSGFFITNDYIVTAYHVIGDNLKISCYDTDGNYYYLKPVYKDKRNDIAVLYPLYKVVFGEGDEKEYFDPPFNNPYYRLGGKPKIGKNYTILGYPHATQSCKEFSIMYHSGLVQECHRNIYRFKGLLAGGISGGPVLDENQSVIGLAVEIEINRSANTLEEGLEYNSRDAYSHILPISYLTDFNKIILSKEMNERLRSFYKKSEDFEINFLEDEDGNFEVYTNNFINHYSDKLEEGTAGWMKKRVGSSWIFNNRLDEKMFFSYQFLRDNPRYEEYSEVKLPKTIFESMLSYDGTVGDMSVFFNVMALGAIAPDEKVKELNVFYRYVDENNYAVLEMNLAKSTFRVIYEIKGKVSIMPVAFFNMMEYGRVYNVEIFSIGKYTSIYLDNGMSFVDEDSPFDEGDFFVQAKNIDCHISDFELRKMLPPGK